MTVTVANTTNTSTYQFWLDRTNELADAMTNKVITVNSNTTVGNAQVNGIFTGTTLTANTLRGGNTTTTTVLTISSNVLISTGNTLTIGNATVNSTITSFTIFTSNNIYVGNSTVNTSVNSTSISTQSIVANGSTGSDGQILTSNGSSIYWANGGGTTTPISGNTQTTGTSTQVVDFTDKTTFRGSEYVATVTNNLANGYQISKLLLLHDSGNSYITEYGVMYSNSQLGVFSSDANATHFRLLFTPTSSNTQVKTVKITIPV